MMDSVWLFYIIYGKYYRLWVTVDTPSYINAFNKLMKEEYIIDEFISEVIENKFYNYDYDESKKMVTLLFPKILRFHGHFVRIPSELRDKFDKEKIYDEDFINVGINTENPYDKGENPFLLSADEWLNLIKNVD